MPTSETRAADAPSSQVDTGRRVVPIRRAPWTIDLLGSVMAGVGLFGFWGGAGDIVGAAQGLGILMLAAGCVLVGRVHAKHHGPGPTRTFHGPRAVLGACLAVAPLALFVTLPASTPSSAIAILAVVFGGMFYAVVRLEDEEAARRPASPRKAGPVATYPEVTTHESPDGADDRRH